MEPEDMTPGWARIIIPLAILAFLAGGAWTLVLAVRQAWPQGFWMVLLACLPGGLLIYIGWRGVPLARCLRFQACIDGDTLRHRQNPSAPVEVTPLSDLKVTRHASMQLIHVDDARTGRRLFTADYVYKRACALVEAIENYQKAGVVQRF